MHASVAHIVSHGWRVSLTLGGVGNVETKKERERGGTEKAPWADYEGTLLGYAT